MAPAWLEKFIVREDPSPDPRRSTDQPTLKLRYTALAEHRRTLSVEGEGTPRYEIAIIDFHSFSTKLLFPSRNHRIDISTTKRKFDANPPLRTLHWKGTGQEVAGAASWELRDETDLVMSVEVDRQQLNGVISVWREGLDAERVKELVVVGIAQIEEYKRMIRNARKSAVGVKVL